MASQPNIEYEAAKFLHKLIQDSKDEPDKLATKLYLILQHMKASGKENSMPYQVISRAMETVVNQHGLDIESMKPPCNLVNSGPQIRDSISPHSAGFSQIGGAPHDSQSGLIETDSFRTEAFSSGRPPAGPRGMTNDTYPGSAPHRSAVSFDHESPSSIDTQSTNSPSYERHDASSWDQQATQKDGKRSSAKRKRPESSASDAHMGDSQQLDAHNTIGDPRKGKLFSKMEFPGPFPDYSLESSAPTTLPQRSVHGHLLSSNKCELTMGDSLSNLDISMQSGVPKDIGKSPILPMSSSSMPFKEHHLKQLRAQCLVFLAFRNGLMPKRLHLEIALGNILPTEGSTADGVQREFVDGKAKEIPIKEPSSNPDTVTAKASVSLFATASQTENSREEASNRRVKLNDEEGKEILGTGMVLEAEMQNQGIVGAPTFSPVQSQNEFSRLKSYNNLDNSVDNGHLHAGAMSEPSIMGMNNQPRPEMIRWAAVGGQNEASRRPFSSSVAHPDSLNRNDSSPSPQYADSNLSVPWKSMQGKNNEKQRMVPAHDATPLRYCPSGTLSDAANSIRNNAPFPQLDKTYESEETNKFSAGVPPPKYTTSEKWILIHQKRRVMKGDNWKKKQERVDRRIVACFNELKETVISSEDISAKTRSVIELKKLQLLELQRCLRSNILNEFFKPITLEIDRLKVIKKHRVGRRLKHVEKYEQRMKEERQKRVNERQKVFFSELEFHKERLDDAFKLKKERWKGFHRYVKEFHKRKERLYREKIDRIQREKINLLKINDVEGYLRMVQDVKSDRVKQLLKETEKYLQKLSAKLQEAKPSAKHLESDNYENQAASVIESSETEDENDQAKNYKESNEKYYLMAHSVKENITEQPTGLVGGKLREYQMNGLRWLVSLYNNNLNGILADEMGLGKTVQVISLICYLMESKNDRGPFLVVVPSSVLPGWESELNFWAPGVNKIVYTGSPEERRRLFKETIVHQKFNVLLTTYEYLMNKHDRPKLSKVHWHYIIIDEGHRIKNASCKLNADLKQYHSSHRLLLTGTPLQNNLEELWALLNFLLPNIFNASEDFSQWFNKPFESNGDNAPDQALLSEEENLLIINRLHQVLRPFVLRRLKHKVENQLPEKIERLVRCEASAYQKLLMKRVEDNLGSLVNSKARSVHNSVMELRNICNHPYLSQLHVDEVDTLIPKHFLPPIVRLCGKLEMLDRLLPKLKATNHRVLFFSTMTRLLDVMEEYLAWKNYHYVRLDGHTSGQERGSLIEQFNRPDSPYFIFLLSIRAGGVGVNLQAADTVILFDTDWNPQVDLQAQARAHRIGQKKDVLVLRLETINTVEEQVRASAEHKLGVANQSITAGFFDNNTSAEDRREYLEALLRECKKEEDAPVLDDDALNDLLARSEVEIDVFESVDQKRREEEMATWTRLMMEKETDDSQVIPPLPSRIVTDDDLKAFNEAMKMYEVSAAGSESDFGLKRKAGSVGGFDAQRYGRGKRAREVRSYEEQWTEEEFEKMCQTESPDTLKLKEEQMDPQLRSESGLVAIKTEPHLQILQALPPTSGESLDPIQNDVTPPVKRGRGRPRRVPPSPASVLSLSGPVKPDTDLQKVSNPVSAITNSSNDPAVAKDTSSAIPQFDACIISSSDATPAIHPTYSGVVSTSPGLSTSSQSKGQNKKGQVGAEPGRRRGRKPGRLSSTVSSSFAAQDSQPSEQLIQQASIDGDSTPAGLSASSEQSKPKGLLDPSASVAEPSAGSSTLLIVSGNTQVAVAETGSSTSHCTTAIATLIPANEVSTPSDLENLPGRRKSQRSQSGAEPVRRMGRRHNLAATNVDVPSSTQHSQPNESNNYSQTSVPQSMKIISAFVQGSATLKEASLTLDNVAAGFAPTIPTPSQPLPSTALSSHTEVPCAPAFLKSEGQNKKGPAEESAPRRRGRKRGISLASGSSNVYSQDKSPSLSENIIKKPEERSLTTAGQGKGVLQSRGLFSPDSKPEDQNDLFSTTVKRNNLSVAASTLEKGAIEAHKSDRNVEVSNASLAKKVEVSTPLVDLPATGKTTVIVLALKACSFNMDKGFVKPEADASQPRFTIVSEAESTSHLGEDLIAPPGFDTAHAYTAADAVVEVPLPRKDSKGKEDDVTENKSTFQTESRATVGRDQNLMDPVPVKILEEESTPPGFQTGGTCSSKTRAAGSVHSESRDASQEASSAQAEASEPPSGFCEESLPPGFGVAQSHLAEARNENVVLNEIGEVSLPPGFDVNREGEDPLKKVQGASEAHTSCSRAPAVLEPEIGNVALDDGSKGKNDELSITGNGIDVCKTNTYVESSTETIDLSEKTVGIIAGVQKDADSLYITEHPDDVSNIAESMHQTMEVDKPQQEKQSTIIGGLKQQVEGKSADFGETCLRDYSSTELETDANDTVNDTSEVMNMSAGMMPEICTDSRTADAVASSIPQIQNEVSLAGPSLAGNVENRTQNSEAPSIPFTFQKDEAHSEKQYDTNDASSLHVEASNGDLELDLESNTEKSHGTWVREQEVFCVEMSGTDSRPTEEHIRSSDAGNDLSFVSKVDNSQGMSDVQKDESAPSLTETLARSSLLETDLEATFILSKTEGQKDGVDSEIRQISRHEASTGDTSCPLAPKEEEVSQRPSVTTQPCSSCTISESEVPIDEADPEMLCDTSSPQAQEGEMSQKPNAAAEPDSSCTVSGSEALSDETDPEMLHDAVLGVSKDEIASSLDTHDQEHCHQRTDNADEEAVCTMPDAMVQHQNDPEVLPDVDCGVSEVKIDSSQGTEVHKESKGQTFQETEEQDASSSPAASVHVELNCTALGSEVQKDEADPEILPDTELSVPKNEVDAPYIPEEPESQKPSIIMQPENPCNDEVLVEEADSELLPEEQKQCQEKKVFPEETANDMSMASSASMGAEGQYIANAKMPRGTDFPSAKDEIGSSQTCEDKGDSLELAIRAELKASDTLLDAHAQLSNEIGISQGCEETIVRDVDKPRATQEQDESEKMIVGVRLEAASALLGFECQKNEVDASADVAASKYELGASQASCENQVMHSPTMECQENEGDAVVGVESRNTTDGTELEAAPMAVETEHKKNEHGESAEAGVPKHKVGDSESSNDQNASPKATAGAQLLAASSIFHKDEAAAVHTRALLDDKSAALLQTLDQDGTQKLVTDSPPKEASGALSDETESGILIDIKASVDEENASQSPKD